MIDAVTDTAEIDLSFMTDEEMEEIRRQIEAEEADRKEKVERLGESLAMKRAEAIRGRSASGIEKKWAFSAFSFASSSMD